MIHVRVLGGFHVDVDGRSADNVLAKSPKGIVLLQYLMLQQGESVPARRLMEIMWPNDTSASPEGALKTLVSRLRTILSQVGAPLAACLATARGGYRWETRPGVTVDLEEFERIAALTENAEELTGEMRRHFRAALQLFGGELLCELLCLGRFLFGLLFGLLGGGIGLLSRYLLFSLRGCLLRLFFLHLLISLWLIEIINVPTARRSPVIHTRRRS